MAEAPQVDDLLAPPDPGSTRGFRPVPSDDSAFEAAIKDASAGCLASGPADLLACMTTRLQVRYPNCGFRPQAELATFPGTPPVIYVYRDG